MNEGNNLENGNNSPVTPNDVASLSLAMPSDPSNPSNPAFLPNIDPSLQQHLAHFALPAGHSGPLLRHHYDSLLLGGPKDGDEREQINDDPLHPEQRGQDGEVELRDEEMENIDKGRTLGGDMSSTTNSPLFPLTATDLPLLDRAMWPPWFVALAEYLEWYNLRARWKDTLGCWMVWEGRAKFEELKGGKYGLPPMGCPPVVTEWIKNYHRITLAISTAEIRDFADQWW